MNDLREFLLNAYEQTNAATCTVFGFYMNDGHDVYAVKVDRLPTDLIVMSRESTARGALKKLKIAPLSDVKRRKLCALGAAYVGTVADVLGDAKNKGDAFEYYIAREWYGKHEHKKTSLPYWKEADIDAGTEQIQVKFECASLANEQTIKNGLKALMK